MNIGGFISIDATTGARTTLEFHATKLITICGSPPAMLCSSQYGAAGKIARQLASLSIRMELIARYGGHQHIHSPSSPQIHKAFCDASSVACEFSIAPLLLPRSSPARSVSKQTVAMGLDAGRKLGAAQGGEIHIVDPAAESAGLFSYQTQFRIKSLRA